MQLYSLKFIAFFSGCFFCYCLQKAGISPALAAALTGLLGSFLHFPKFYERKGLHAAIYSGSFAGMCSHEIIQHPYQIIILSLLGAGIYLFMKSRILGFGGKLGAVSFAASCIYFLARNVW